MGSLKQLFENNQYLFHFLNLTGWAGWAFTSYLAGRYWGAQWGLIGYRLFSAAVGLAICLVMRYLFHKIWNMSLSIRVFTVIVGSYIAAATMVTITNLMLWQVYDNGYSPDDLMKYFKGITQYFYIFVCWSGLYFGFKFYRGMQDATQKALKAHSLAHQAQLKMLRYQLNPHFLFNTLNAISTLIIDKKNEQANDMVTRLSNFLRYSLDNDPMQKVSLAQEISALQLYLDIEKVRFEERLTLEFDIEEDANNALIPSMVLQPIVENSIKYAIAQSENGGTLSLRARVFASELLLELGDNGPGMKTSHPNASNGCGVGIRNTRERLTELYGQQHGFELVNLKPQGLQVNIRIPFETK